MEYSTLYDVAKINIFDLYLDQWPVLLPGLVVLISLFKLFHDKRKNSTVTTYVFFGIKFNMAMAFSVFGAIVFFYLNYSLLYEFMNLRKMLIDNQCKIVEGAVTELNAAIHEGGGPEEIKVNNISFRYTDYSITAAYHKTVLHGGLISLGKKVKIYYFDFGAGYDGPIIAKVDIIR